MKCIPFSVIGEVPCALIYSMHTVYKVSDIKLIYVFNKLYVKINNICYLLKYNNLKYSPSVLIESYDEEELANLIKFKIL